MFLGMGLPTTPAYIVEVALLVPAVGCLMQGAQRPAIASLSRPAHRESAQAPTPGPSENRSEPKVMGCVCARRDQSEEKTMSKSLLAGCMVLLSLAASPAMGQQEQGAQAQSDVVLVGLPVYSSDGEKLGQVTEVGTAAGRRAVQAQIGGFLGVETSTVVIPDHVFQQKPDRIELSMTAAEVGETITKQKEKQGQQQKQ
jgi:hypothetical protein